MVFGWEVLKSEKISLSLKVHLKDVLYIIG